MIAWAMAMIAGFKTVILAGLGVIVFFAIAETFHKTRSVVGAGVVLLLGAGLMWATSNIQVVQNKVGTDVTTPGALAPLPTNLLPAAPVAVLAGRGVDVRLVVYRPVEVGGDGRVA